MQDLPKIVLARLSVAAPGEAHSAQVHPDADVLTAFAEQALTKSERSLVIDHLSDCADCREIVALALPDPEIIEIAAAAEPTRDRWLNWPVLRWGFVVAGIVIVAFVGMVQYRKSQPAMTATAKYAPGNGTRGAATNTVTNAPASAAPSTRTLDSAQPASPPPQDRSQTEFRATPLADRTSASAPVTAPAPAVRESYDTGSVGSGASLGGPLVGSATAGGHFAAHGSLRARGKEATTAPPDNTNVLLADADASQAAPAKQSGAQVNVPNVTESVEVSASPVAVNETQTQVAQNDVANLDADKADRPTTDRPKSELPINGRNLVALETVEKAKPAVASAASPAADSSGARDSQATMLVARSVAPLWEISATGSLQRSTDAGKTWQPVSVSAGVVGGQIAAYGALAKKAKDQTDDKALRREIGGPVFRAVAANGAEVWAGGGAGALYHSTDGGDHWGRVVPSAAGVALTGDIVRVEFSGSQRSGIAITTSTSETWITADDGQSWRRQ